MATIPIHVKTASNQTISEYLQVIKWQAVVTLPYEHTQQLAKNSPGSQQASMFQTLLVIQPPKDASTHENFGKWQRNGQQHSLTLELWLSTDEITATASFDS